MTRTTYKHLISLPNKIRELTLGKEENTQKCTYRGVNYVKNSKIK